jgi:hypothetical protein
VKNAVAYSNASVAGTAHTAKKQQKTRTKKMSIDQKTTSVQSECKRTSCCGVQHNNKVYCGVSRVLECQYQDKLDHVWGQYKCTLHKKIITPKTTQ